MGEGPREGLWSGPIVDAHQHFWDPFTNPHPWLARDAAIPFRYGDYGALKRRYLPPDYRRDALGHDVRESVYVEAEWSPADPLGETRYAASLAARHGLPSAIVAQAWLDREDVAEVLGGQAACPIVRGVRHKPGGPASPDEVGRGRTLMSDRRWRDGYALLARHGLSFDLQTPWWNLDEAVRLARDFPATTLVLNHAGLPSDRGPRGLAGWHRHMARLAEMPNAVAKISGLGLAGRPWIWQENAWIVREVVAMFGAGRAMFASNFPVDGLCASLDTILTGWKRIVADLPAADQAQLFHGTARRVYRTGGAA